MSWNEQISKVDTELETTKHSFQDQNTSDSSNGLTSAAIVVLAAACHTSNHNRSNKLMDEIGSLSQ
jgi:hypothetical protein